MPPKAPTSREIGTAGPFNQHFIRDIGLIFLFVGTQPFCLEERDGNTASYYGRADTLWLAGYALFHFWEVAVGICEPSALARDFPAVTLPAVIGALLTLWAVQEVTTIKRPAVMIG
jgi:hypothetical protein